MEIMKSNNAPTIISSKFYSLLSSSEVQIESADEKGEISYRYQHLPLEKGVKDATINSLSKKTYDEFLNEIFDGLRSLALLNSKWNSVKLSFNLRGEHSDIQMKAELDGTKNEMIIYIDNDYPRILSWLNGITAKTYRRYFIENNS